MQEFDQRKLRWLNFILMCSGMSSTSEVCSTHVQSEEKLRSAHCQSVGITMVTRSRPFSVQAYCIGWLLAKDFTLSS